MIQRKALRFLAAASALALISPTAAQQAPPGADISAQGFTSAKARELAAQAAAMGGEDLGREVASMCRKPKPDRIVGPPPPPGTMVPPPKPRVARPAYESNRVFDNVYYFGTSEVGATVIRTTRGLVLIDTLTTSEDAARVLVGGMMREKLDPADIKYVVVTHAHGDHHGGVKYLREHYPRFKVVMSADDWAFSERPFFMPDGNLDTAPRPPRARGDIAYSGTYELKLGDTTFHLIETPGHTPGTTSLLYTVRNGGRNETVAQWGGGGPMNTLFSLETVERFILAAKAAGPSILWGSHSNPVFWGLSSRQTFVEKAAAAQNGPPELNPFVADREKVRRYLDVVLICKRAIALDDAKP